MLKYLRIAVTVLSLTAYVLLIALWVRSYQYAESLAWGISKGRSAGITSRMGRVYVCAVPEIKSKQHFWSRQLPLESEWMRTRLPQFENAFGFGAFQELGGSYVIVPYWFLVLLTAAIAAVPWIRRRFSLRILLIATTLVAVVLGIIVGAR